MNPRDRSGTSAGEETSAAGMVPPMEAARQAQGGGRPPGEGFYQRAMARRANARRARDAEAARATGARDDRLPPQAHDLHEQREADQRVEGEYRRDLAYWDERPRRR